MTLSADLVALIQSVARQHGPDVPDQVIVRIVVETLAGRQPDGLLSAMNAAGGAAAFVGQLLDEVRRVRPLMPSKA